jgi:hypothetical protein
MNRPELAALPLEERRKLQREAGFVTADTINHERNQYKPTKKDRSTKMETQTHTQTNEQKERARQSVEHFSDTMQRLGDTLRQQETLLRTVKRAGVYAAIWAPVGLGVGYGLLKMARRIFTPTDVIGSI